MLSRVFLALLAVSAPFVSAIKYPRKSDLHARQVEAAQRWRPRSPDTSSNTRSGVKNITFTNPKASGEP